VETHMRAMPLCGGDSGRTADRCDGHRAARVDAPWLDMTRAAICWCASASIALDELCCLVDALGAANKVGGTVFTDPCRLAVVSRTNQPAVPF